jgi:subtilisin-like proprotein convertase family protein
MIPDLLGPNAVSGTVFQDNNGNGSPDTTEPGLPGVTVFLDTNNNGLLDPASTSTVSTSVAQSISTSRNSTTITTSALSISGATTPIAGITVNLTIATSRDSSLTALLVGPDNAAITLFSGVGGSGANFTNTTLSDQAATSIATGSASFTGTYRPSPDPLSVFNGRSANGTWTLEIINVRRGPTGTLQNWSMTITTAAELSTTTAADGTYAFSSVPLGNYTVQQIVPANQIQLAPGAGFTPSSNPVQMILGNVTGTNFGDFPTAFAGGSFYVALGRPAVDPTQDYVQISQGNAPLSPPTYQVPAARLATTPLAFDISGGDHTLTVDFTNGNPIVAGLSVTGGGGNDLLKIISGPGADTVTASASQVTFGTTAITYSGLTGLEFDGGGNDTLTVAAALPFLPVFTGSGQDTLNIQAGAYTIATDLSTTTPNLALALSGSAAATFSTAQRLSSLSIGDSTTATMSTGGNNILILQALSISGTGTLDLANNPFMLNTPDAATRDASLASLTSLIGAARDGGAWDKPGITSSAARADTSALTGLGIIANANPDGTPIYATTWENQPVNANSILVKYTLNGDANLDGKITFDDYFQANQGFLSAGAKTGYRWGDFNYDGLINFDDYFLINRAFLGQSTIVIPQTAALAAVARPKAMTSTILHHNPKVKRHAPSHSAKR